MQQNICATIVAAMLGVVVADAGFVGAAEKPKPYRADVSYGPHPHQLLDVYLPDESGPFPLLVWYGGLWKPAKSVPDVGRFFNARVAVIGVQMRVMQDAISQHTEPPVSVCLLDACRAIQFLRLHAAEFKLDPSRIVVGGGSQGALPALYVGCVKDRASPESAEEIDRMSTKVRGVGAWRSQPSIDPVRMQEWVPGVQWGAPALGFSFAESLKRRSELLPWIREWSPDSLLNKDSSPIFFENNWGLTKPEGVEPMDYKVHAPQWGLGFQKLAQEQGVPCFVKFPGHPSERRGDMWDFLIDRLKGD